MVEDRLHDAAWQERTACVLSGALRVWGITGTVARDPAHAGRFDVSSTKTELRIEHRSQGGWLVLSDKQVVLGEHAGLVGLLRSLREELAPHAAAGRLVIGSQSLL